MVGGGHAGGSRRHRHRAARLSGRHRDQVGSAVEMVLPTDTGRHEERRPRDRRQDDASTRRPRPWHSRARVDRAAISTGARHSASQPAREGTVRLIDASGPRRERPTTAASGRGQQPRRSGDLSPPSRWHRRPARSTVRCTSRPVVALACARAAASPPRAISRAASRAASTARTCAKRPRPARPAQARRRRRAAGQGPLRPSRSRARGRLRHRTVSRRLISSPPRRARRWAATPGPTSRARRSAQNGSRVGTLSNRSLAAAATEVGRQQLVEETGEAAGADGPDGVLGGVHAGLVADGSDGRVERVVGDE